MGLLDARGIRLMSQAFVLGSKTRKQGLLFCPVQASRALNAREGAAWMLYRMTGVESPDKPRLRTLSNPLRIRAIFVRSDRFQLWERSSPIRASLRRWLLFYYRPNDRGSTDAIVWVSDPRMMGADVSSHINGAQRGVWVYKK